MPGLGNWRDVLIKECERVKLTGGEVKIQFRKRSGYKVFATIFLYPDNMIQCAEEILSPLGRED